VVRNRRYARLRAMLAAGDEFFSDEQMEERAPGVFHAVLGRHLDAAAADAWQARDDAGPVDSAGQPVEAAVQAAIDAAYDDASAASHAAARASAAAGAAAEPSAARWGSLATGGDARTVDAGAAPEQTRASRPGGRARSSWEAASPAEAAHKPALSHGLSEMMISALMRQRQRGRRRATGMQHGEDADEDGNESEARGVVPLAERRAALMRVMCERFVDGADAAHYDYANVDADAALDVSAEGEQDSQDAYFDDDDDGGGVGGRVGGVGMGDAPTGMQVEPAFGAGGAELATPQAAEAASAGFRPRHAATGGAAAAADADADADAAGGAAVQMDLDDPGDSSEGGGWRPVE
jgi:hypothetical protein